MKLQVKVDKRTGAAITTSASVAEFFGRAEVPICGAIQILTIRGKGAFRPATCRRPGGRGDQKTFLMDRESFSILTSGFKRGANLKEKILGGLVAFDLAEVEHQESEAAKAKAAKAIIKQQAIVGLISIDHTGRAVTDSIKVSEMFGRQHLQLCKKIEGLISSGCKGFRKYSLGLEQNKVMYVMDRIGFAQLVAGYKGETAHRGKIRFNAAFDRFEEELSAAPRPKVDATPKTKEVSAAPPKKPAYNPITTNLDGKVVAHSRFVSNHIGRPHGEILAKIRTLIKNKPIIGPTGVFDKSSYVNLNGVLLPAFRIDRQAFNRLCSSYYVNLKEGGEATVLKAFAEAEHRESEATPTTLVYIDEDGRVVTDSRKVAEVFKRNHWDVTGRIRRLVSEGRKGFRLSHFRAKFRKTSALYLMDRETFQFLVNPYRNPADHVALAAFTAAFAGMGSESKPQVTQPEPKTKKDPMPMPEIVEPEIVEPEPASLDIKDLVVQDENGRLITDSLKVAEVFGKRHDNVIAKIEALDCSENFRALNFKVSSYKPVGASRSYPKVIMTFDGYTFLVGGFSGKKAAKFKEQYIAAFNEMRERLFAPAQPMSQLEILLGAVNGLVAQDKRLKEIDAKVDEVDERNRATAEKVSELDHVFHTNGCAKGFIPVADALGTYGNELSRAMFLKVMRDLGQPVAPYRFKRPDGEWGQGWSIKKDGIVDAMSKFKATTSRRPGKIMWTSTLYGNRLFKMAA